MSSGSTTNDSPVSYLSSVPALHVPEEPEQERLRWWGDVAEGRAWEDVLCAPGGLAEWLWQRWRVLERAGLAHEDFVALVHAYRRELWFWLQGDRTWGQACAGLIGRLQRRAASRRTSAAGAAATL